MARDANERVAAQAAQKPQVYYPDLIKMGNDIQNFRRRSRRSGMPGSFQDEDQTQVTPSEDDNDPALATTIDQFQSLLADDGERFLDYIQTLRQNNDDARQITQQVADLITKYTDLTDESEELRTRLTNTR
ncbi:MAG: hypothetical protein Q9228_007733, partial [Teloschistes exilis]